MTVEKVKNIYRFHRLVFDKGDNSFVSFILAIIFNRGDSSFVSFNLAIVFDRGDSSFVSFILAIVLTEETAAL